MEIVRDTFRRLALQYNDIGLALDATPFGMRQLQHETGLGGPHMW